MEINKNILPSGFCAFIEINRNFVFLNEEEYVGQSFYIGREISVKYYNRKINQKISIILCEPNTTSKCWDWYITIEKHKLFYTKKLVVTDLLISNKNNSIFTKLEMYSDFILTSLMPVVRGEKWTIENFKMLLPQKHLPQPICSNDLFEEEQYFYKIYLAFNFLLQCGYHYYKFNIYNNPYITYKNHVSKLEIHIVMDNSNHKKFDVIIKKKWGEMNKISVSELIEHIENTDIRTIYIYANYIKHNLMPVIRGERWL